MDKDLIEDILYQLIDQVNERLAGYYWLAIFIGKEFVQDSKNWKKCLWYISVVYELVEIKSSIWITGNERIIWIGKQWE